MSLTWRKEPDPVLARPGWDGWLRALLRAGPILLVLLLGLAATLLLQVVERSILRPRRPVSPRITVLVCRAALRLMGLRVRSRGRPMTARGMMVANHSSWLDILALNAQGPVVFVAKSEVANWPGIGLLARATGTLFIRREARDDAARQVRAVAERLSAGETLLIFPEGTSTDGRQVLPFKPALFAGLQAAGMRNDLCVQPVTLSWRAPAGQDPRFYAWWGGMEFGAHALTVLAARRPGGGIVTFHPPIRVAGRDRKSLASEAEATVRAAL